MVSFIVPAHNEEAFIGPTLEAINASAREAGVEYEIVVVNDASTDATPEIARKHGAIVLDVDHRHIAATRNSGARAAKGEFLFFVDADTRIDPQLVIAAIRRLQKGAVGGGAVCRFGDKAPLYAHLLLWWFNIFGRLSGVCGGAFLFCTRAAFLATGGFDERMFAAEDAQMCWDLKNEGRFVILWPKAVTSGRRLRGAQGFRAVFTLLYAGVNPKILTQRSALKKVWYNSNRAESVGANTLGLKLANAIALCVVILLVTGPIWILPWPRWILDTPLGTVKRISNIVGLHIGLLLWPCLYYAICVAIHQKRLIERLKVAIFIMAFAWLAWRNTGNFIRFWLPAQKNHVLTNR